MQHSRNALSLSSLKITTSLLGDRSPSSREIVIIRELFTASRSISWLTLYLHYKKALRQLVLTELRRTLQNCNVYGLGCYFLMVLCLTLFPGKWRVAQVPNVRMQHSRNALSLSSLKITTSLLGDRSPSSREIVIIRELFTASRSISWLTLYLHYKKALRQLVLTELRRTLQNCNVYGLGCYFLMVLCLTLFPGKWRVAQVP